MPTEDKTIIKTIASDFSYADTLVVIRKRPADDRKPGFLTVRCIKKGKRFMKDFTSPIPAVSAYGSVEDYYAGVLRAVREADASFHRDALRRPGVPA